MNADGTTPTNISNTAGQDRGPTWSPNGQKLAFLTLRDGNFEIYLMDADGSDQVNFTMTAADEADPDWGA